MQTSRAARHIPLFFEFFICLTSQRLALNALCGDLLANYFCGSIQSRPDDSHPCWRVRRLPPLPSTPKSPMMRGNGEGEIEQHSIRNKVAQRPTGVR
jgi:hypothetical protein